MSRHRIIKNLNLEDELDDHAMFSGEEGGGEEWDEMDDQQQAQMASGLSSIQSILGSSGLIKERDMKEALWNYFFDVESSIAYLLEEQHKREAAKVKAAEAKASKNSSRPSTPLATAKPPKAYKRLQTPVQSNITPTIASVRVVSQLRSDLEGMNLVPTLSRGVSSMGEEENNSGQGSSLKVAGGGIELSKEMEVQEAVTPVVSIAKEKILELVLKKESEGKPSISLVVVGHVDAGKSTLMGRVLHELGETTERALDYNMRQSQKIGKGSFAYAWSLDALEEERERGVTIDVAIDTFTTPSKRFTLIDAPGHRDFIPNMISGAAQADTAVLVIDGATGAFEKGFEGGGQTREHAVLVRSLGVRQLVVVVNKLDAVEWSQARFETIGDQLKPFLTATGFQPSKISFVPVAATSGENLLVRSNEKLKAWYSGPTLVEQLDLLDVPTRSLDAPLRIPVSNVFRGQTATSSGLAISGRIESGIVQIGERLACLPGDETGVVRSIEVDGLSQPWAIAGVNATIFLAGIDPNQLSVGSVLCPPNQLVPVISTFTAQIIVFDLKYPITAGSSIELFHHSRDIPATISILEAVLDKTSGEILKKNPRMLTKGTSARVQVSLRSATSGVNRQMVIPLETFATNKSMGRVLFRRGGETIAAGIVTALS